MYDNHLDCQWTIRLGFDSVIVFEVLTIDIYKQSVDCQGDFFEVRDLKKWNQLVNCHLVQRVSVMDFGGSKYYQMQVMANKIKCGWMN